jgi:hypothetical protein
VRRTSWDIFIQDFPPDAHTIAEIPNEFDPAPLGPRAAIMQKILEGAPFADFSDPIWGTIDGEGYAIELDLGAEELVDGFTLHVRGGDLAVACVVAVIEDLGVQAIDSSMGDFFKPADALASLRQWRACRDHIVGSSEEAPK